MREIIEYMIQQIVDNPQEVKVQEIKGQKVTLFETHVAKGDRSKVIGKGGRVANALRILVGTTAGKLKKRAIVEISEE